MAANDPFAITAPGEPRLKDKVALVTGASSGIGAAVVRRFTAEGARVIAVDLDSERIGELQNASESVVATTCDVTDSAQVDAAFDLAVQTWGKVDVAVTCAGVALEPVDIEEIDDATFARVVEVNLHGTFYCLRAAARHMRRNAPSSGAIVTISSVGALAPFPLPAPYPGAKAGVLGMTRAVAALLAKDNIRVNALAPGATDTPMMPQDPEVREFMLGLQPMARAVPPEEMAANVLYLASGDASFMVGQTVSPNGGYVMGS